FSPTLDQHLCLLQRGEDLTVQELITQLPVEALNIPVLPRTARFNVQRLHTNLTQPLPHHLRRELRTVVRTDVIRNATHREQPRQPFQHIIRLELPSNIDRQALPCELIHH